MTVFRTVCRTLVCLAVLSMTANAAPAAMPTLAEAQADFQSGNSPACLRKVSTLLSPDAAAAAPGPVQRYDLLMLRGQCMLGLKQQAAAQQAFESAAGVMKNRSDVERAAQATAMAILVKRSPELSYKSKADDRTFDIVQPQARKDAMNALLHDLAAEVTPAADKALQGTSLVPMEQLLPAMWQLYAVDVAAAGDPTVAVAKLKELGGHARSLIAAEMDRLTGRLENLRSLANEPTLSGNGSNEDITFRGLTSPERSELQEMADYLMKIQRVCENGRRIARLLGNNGENWDALLADCATARDVAEQAYARRY